MPVLVQRRPGAPLGRRRDGRTGTLTPKQGDGGDTEQSARVSRARARVPKISGHGIDRRRPNPFSRHGGGLGAPSASAGARLRSQRSAGATIARERAAGRPAATASSAQGRGQGRLGRNEIRTQEWLELILVRRALRRDFSHGGEARARARVSASRIRTFLPSAPSSTRFPCSCRIAFGRRAACRNGHGLASTWIAAGPPRRRTTWRAMARPACRRGRLRRQIVP